MESHLCSNANYWRRCRQKSGSDSLRSREFFFRLQPNARSCEVCMFLSLWLTGVNLGRFWSYLWCILRLPPAAYFMAVHETNCRQYPFSWAVAIEFVTHFVEVFHKQTYDWYHIILDWRNQKGRQALYGKQKCHNNGNHDGIVRSRDTAESKKLVAQRARDCVIKTHLVDWELRDKTAQDWVDENKLTRIVETGGVKLASQVL